jgi:hypothetical protein
MLYNDIVTYEHPYFRYDGVRLVEPSEIYSGDKFGEASILAAFMVNPVSVETSVVFVPIEKIFYDTGLEQITNTTSSISFSDIDGYGVVAFNVLDEEAEIISSAEVVYISPVANSESKSQSQLYVISSTKTTGNNISAQIQIDTAI